MNAFELVSFAGDRLVADSRDVARRFGKHHRHVLRDIRGLLGQVDAEFAKSNFGLCTEASERQRGKPQPFYQLTKDGFVLLVMGFTGADAMLWKLKYIGAFNAMSQVLQGHRDSLWNEMHKLIAQEAGSKVRATFGSHLMLKRRRELPFFRRERAKLECQIQRPLELM
jgi:Rha family phage regulatory protein